MENSSLNRLPAELRLEIFECVFTYESLACKASLPCKTGRWLVKRKGQRGFLGLAKELGPTLVCKQMRNETLHLLMSLNTVVFGNERGDIDPYRDWWLEPALDVPCSWADRLCNMAPVFISGSTTFELHLWVWPNMMKANAQSNMHWVKFSKILESLVESLGSMKLLVALHIQYHYENLVCPEIEPYLYGPYGETVLEIPSSGSAMPWPSLTEMEKSFDYPRRALEEHRAHDSFECRVKHHEETLTEQLRRAEQGLRRIVQIAISARRSEARGLHVSTSIDKGKACANEQSVLQDDRRDWHDPKAE